MRKLNPIYLKFLLLILLVLSACSTYAPNSSFLGKSTDFLSNQLGSPTQVLKTSTGQTWIYAKGPYGLQTYFIQIDSRGHVISWQQVLTPKMFQKIQPGMSKQQVIQLIGPSKIETGLARDRGYVWAWRYEMSNCTWFMVEFDKTDQVRSTGYGLPPECNIPSAH